MEELDLKELLIIFWNRKYHIILIVALFITLGAAYSIIGVVPAYKASTTIVLAKAEQSNPAVGTETVADTSITQTDLTLNQKLVSTYSELIKSKKVLRAVIQNLKINLEEDVLRRNITVNSVKNTELIEITVTGERQSQVADIANMIAEVFSEQVAQIYNINNLYVVDEAEMPTIPYNINHTKTIGIFAFIGFVLGCIFVLLANMLDTTIKSAEDIERRAGLPVLAQMPEYNFENNKGGK